MLGSGVSHTVGIPMWRPLVSEMIRRACGSTRRRIEEGLAESLLAWTDNPLLLVRQLEGLLDFRSKVLELLRQCLYETYREKKARVQLETICRQLLSNGPCSTQHVITYNFDNTLERCLSGLGRDYHVVHSAATFSETKRTLRIYHPHGYLPHPADDPEDRFLEEAIVFSERDYHSQYMQSANWVNALQLHHFMSRSCLLIGLSVSDPNLRRLLDYAHTQHRGVHPHRHFAIQKLEQSELQNRLLSMQLEGLGVKVLWVRKYSEISGLLNRCCE